MQLELGGKSPNIVFADAPNLQAAAESAASAIAFNQGEVCTCPSRALIQESIYDKFMARALDRVKAIKQGNPLDTETMMGAQASAMQMDKIMSYLELGKAEGAQCLIGGGRAELGGDLAGGYYIQPTLFKGHNGMRVFREEIFGPVLAVTTFKNEDEALAIADLYAGLGLRIDALQPQGGDGLDRAATVDGGQEGLDVQPVLARLVRPDPLGRDDGGQDGAIHVEQKGREFAVGKQQVLDQRQAPDSGDFR